MRHSIKRQLALVFIILITGTIFCSWFFNVTFLESYYMNKKENALMNVYHKINEASVDGGMEAETFDMELLKICGKYNVHLLVLDENFQLLKATMHDPDILVRQLLDNIFFAGSHSQYEKILDQTQDYVLHSIIDTKNHEEYIEMWGFLESGALFLLRTPKEGIAESAQIANRFLVYTGLASLLIGSGIIWIVSRKITEPILELARISEKMACLDFETKYEGNMKNEVGVLGDNMNLLSRTLEGTISELKTVNNELKKDVEKKERIDEMRKEFLSNVSHELKTPIALIQGYAEGLREGINEDPESREFYCEVIMDEAARMNNLVQKLLTLNQLEFGNDAVEMERFDLTAMITTLVQSADILAKQSGIQVKIDSREACYVWADVYKTEEVIRNYFSNALNHCSGEKIIHIHMTREQDKVRVGIFNTGRPIAEDALPHIWEKFYKADKARTREYGGSGVGLSIVKALMESMNEQYGVTNYDNGVEFWFELAIN
ncbi:HAMP domain-containing sensor histidine kinase [Lachnospiraceae bacterium JLR.KK008]